MKHFAKQKDIITTTADKGGAVVIMDTENYIKEVNHQLSDKITSQHNKMVNDYLTDLKTKIYSLKKLQKD